MKYARPESINSACTLLEDESVTILAGGTDLLPRYEQGRELPELLVDIKHIPELNTISVADDGSVEIGSLVTVYDLLHHDHFQDKYPALVESARDFAAVQIRQRATIGGNLCNASPAGDLLPPLYALNATAHIANGSDERNISISEFINGPGKTDLRPGELLKSISLPEPKGSSLFVKLGLRDAMAISVINFAISYQIAEGKFTELRIAAGAVGPTIKMLSSYSGAVLENLSNVSNALDLVDEDISPIDDLRATAKYRSRVLKNLLEHTLLDLLESHDD
jgi:xanthine dehydrogenase FAD-binding subunit